MKLRLGLGLPYGGVSVLGYSINGTQPAMVADFVNGVYYANGARQADASFLTYTGDALSVTDADGGTTAYGANAIPYGHHISYNGTRRNVGIKFDTTAHNSTLTVPFSLFSGLSGAISIVVHVTSDFTESGGSSDLQFIRLQQDANENLICQEILGTGTIQFKHETGGVTVADSVTEVFDDSTARPYAIAMRANATEIQGVIDGTLSDIGTTTGFPAITSAGINIGLTLFGAIGRVVVYEGDIGEAGLIQACVASDPPVHILADSFFTAPTGKTVQNKFRDDGKIVPVTTDAVGGSTITEQATRFASTPEYYDSTLIVADMGNTSSVAERQTAVDDITARLSHGRWLVMQPAPDPPDKASPDLLVTDFANDATGVRATIGAATTVGSTACHALTEDTSTNSHFARMFYTGDGDAKSFVFDVRANGRDWVRIQASDSGGAARFAYFNVSTGAVGQKSSSTGFDAHIFTTNLDSFYRCIIYLPTTESGSTEFDIMLADADGSFSYTGDGSSGVYLSEAYIFDPSQTIYADDVTFRTYIGSDRWVSMTSEAWSEDATDEQVELLGMWPVSIRESVSDFHPSDSDGDSFLGDRVKAALEGRGWVS